MVLGIADCRHPASIAALGFLNSGRWVGGCQMRDGELSLHTHRALFDEVSGTKWKLTQSKLDPASAELLAWMS